MKGEFKNLPSGWSRYELGEICKISSSKFDPTKSNDVKKCIELEHLSQKQAKFYTENLPVSAKILSSQI